MAPRPEAQALLSLARSIVLRELVPALPADKRYEARMVANAVAIAARELSAGGEARSETAVALASVQDHIEAAAPEEIERALAAAIRAGDHDADTTIHAAMTRVVIADLRISNPKALEKNGES